MKKLIYAAMAIAMLVGCKQAKNAEAETVEEPKTDISAIVESGDMVYVVVDAVIAQCDMDQTEGVALRSKMEKAQTSWAQKEQKLQSEMAQLQEKYQKGLITSIEAQRKQEDLQKRAANYETSRQNEAKTLEEEITVYQNRMQDLLGRAIKDINADKRYKLIIQASALLDGDETLNITELVLNKVNELYKADKATK